MLPRCDEEGGTKNHPIFRGAKEKLDMYCRRSTRMNYLMWKYPLSNPENVYFYLARPETAIEGKNKEANTDADLSKVHRHSSCAIKINSTRHS